jgi:hypothetical protein
LKPNPIKRKLLRSFQEIQPWRRPRFKLGCGAKERIRKEDVLHAVTFICSYTFCEILGLNITETNRGFGEPMRKPCYYIV